VFVTANSEIESLPALTANSVWPSGTSAIAPWEPRFAPVPRPPLGTVPAYVSVPSFERANVATPLPAAEFVSVKTAACESASLCDALAAAGTATASSTAASTASFRVAICVSRVEGRRTPESPTVSGAS
jgi:hypothetical protein